MCVPIKHPALTKFMQEYFARVWKIAEVTCVPKDGDAGNPCNNRPISLLPVLSKVNERLAHRQFVTFLDNNNKPSQFQTGNRKQSGISLNLRTGPTGHAPVFNQ